MMFEYLAIACGGIGPDTWDKEIVVSGENLTIKQALEKAELAIVDTDGAIISIEQID